MEIELKNRDQAVKQFNDHINNWYMIKKPSDLLSI